MRMPIMTIIYIKTIKAAQLLPRYKLYEISCFKIRKLILIGEQMD